MRRGRHGSRSQARNRPSGFFGRLAAAAQEGREDLRVGRAVGVGDADGLVLRIHNKFLIPLGNGLDGALPAAELGKADDLSLRVALQKRA